jgi:putative membrane protein
MSEQHAPTSNQSDAPRRVDLAIARIDAWTVMKVSFLLSVAFGIAIVIATIVLWFMLDAMHVFSTLESFLQEIGAGKFTELLEYVRLPRTIAYATIVGVINVVLMTATSTLGAMLYNVVASLVGGIKVSLMDE